MRDLFAEKLNGQWKDNKMERRYEAAEKQESKEGGRREGLYERKGCVQERRVCTRGTSVHERRVCMRDECMRETSMYEREVSMKEKNALKNVECMTGECEVSV